MKRVLKFTPLFAILLLIAGGFVVWDSKNYPVPSTSRFPRLENSIQDFADYLREKRNERILRPKLNAFRFHDKTATFVGIGNASLCKFCENGKLEFGSFFPNVETKHSNQNFTWSRPSSRTLKITNTDSEKRFYFRIADIKNAVFHLVAEEPFYDLTIEAGAPFPFGYHTLLKFYEPPLQPKPLK